METQVGNDIKNAFDQFGKSDLIKKMEKGFKDFNLQLKQSKVGQTFTKTFEQVCFHVTILLFVSQIFARSFIAATHSFSLTPCLTCRLLNRPRLKR